ncbi:MAG: alpha/beta hydrolase [Actinomycetota bacterium]|nr:alpha/beta hydrolase [Actinomycetota bacterium]
MHTDTVTLPSQLDLTLSEGGPVRARPVLVLHGGGGPFTIAPIAAHYEADSHVLLPTHPGWDGTPRPDGVADIPALGALYLQLLADRDLREVLVIGSSLGGWIAAEMAASDTEHRIGRLVIIDGAGIEVPEHPVVNFFGLTLRQIAEHSWHNPERGFIDPSTLPPERIAAQRANMQTMGVYTARHGMHDPALQSRLGLVSIPVLVLWGASDRVFTPGYGRAYAAAFPNARFEVIAEAGHLPQLEQPVATFAALDGFLGRDD